MTCDRVGLGVLAGVSKVSIGRILAGVGVSVGTIPADDAWGVPGMLAERTSADSDGVGLIEPAGPTTCGDDKVGRAVPTGLTAVAGGDDGAAATPPLDSGAPPAPNAFAGI